jgi:hypothetical protein
MGHPSTNYVRYLVVRGAAEGDLRDADSTLAYYNEVVDTLTYYNLPPIGDRSFERLIWELRVPLGLQVNNLRHKKTQEYMKQEGLYDIWNPTPKQKEVFNLLRRPLAMDTIKVLLMGHIFPDEISGRVARKHRLEVSEEAVAMFAHYFWDVEFVSQLDWKSLLQGHPLKDHMMAALNGSPEQARYRAGFTPAIDGERTLKDAHMAIHFRIEATRNMPDSPDTASVLARLAKELVNIHQSIYGEGAGLEEILRKFKAFKMETKDPEVREIMDLAPSGNYSGASLSRGEKDVKRIRNASS